MTPLCLNMAVADLMGNFGATWEVQWGWSSWDVLGFSGTRTSPPLLIKVAFTLLLSPVY